MLTSLRYYRAVASGFYDELPYVKFGDGPETVVVIPGIDDALHQFRWFPRLWAWYFRPLAAAGRRVIVVSRSRDLSESVSTAVLAERYEAAIALYLGPVHLVGISMGGLIAQHIAARRPDLVRRLVLAVTAHRLPSLGQRHGRRLTELAESGSWRAFFSYMNAICFTGAHRVLMELVGWICGSRLFGPRTAAARDFARSARACAEHDGSALLPRIAAPTLVWGAGADCLFPYAMLTQMSAALPRSELHRAEGAHAAFVQSRSSFHDAVARFLSRADPETGERAAV